MSTQSFHDEAYVSLMKGLTELDLPGSCVPSALLLTDRAFPLAMNSQGQVLMAASLYGRGRIVVLSHEGYLTTFPALVENAVTWLSGDQSDTLSVGVHKNVKADNLRKSSFQVKDVEAFSGDLGVGVYVTDAYSVGADPKDLVAFMKEGGGVLIGGQAWHWASQHPNENTILQFPGNKVSGVAGIYFTESYGEAEKLSVTPQIPTSWKALDFGKNFVEDLEFLLKGISEFDLPTGSTASEVLVHGRLAFPIGTTEDGRAFLAGTYYGLGRVIVVSHEALLQTESLASFWNNAIQWLDQGRKGVAGSVPGVKIFTDSGLKCETTDFRKDLSVFVSTVYRNEPVVEIQEFVAEGGGLLIGGHDWWWSYCHPDQNPLTDFSGNKILNKMGLSLLPGTIGTRLYKAPVPSQAMKDNFHFRYLLRCFVGHVISGEELTEQKKKHLEKMVNDCVNFLSMKAYDNFSYAQVLSIITDTVKLAMPQVSEQNPVNTPKDLTLLDLGQKLYKVCPDPDALLPYLIKDIPPMPVVYNQRIKINAKTAEDSEWISTGLYLSPGMKTSMTIPTTLVNNRWKVQIGCQTDYLNHKSLVRARYVCESFPVTSETMQVSNLWGGLIYLVAPPDTNMEGAEVVVEKAVSAPYFKSGVTTAAEWSLLRAAPSPWAELEFDNLILSVPSHVVRDLENPEDVATLWNSIMKGVAELAVIPSTFARKERFVTDVQISAGFMHSGYPIMMFTSSAPGLVDIKNTRTYGCWGEIHELGHNNEKHWRKFLPFVPEGTCNLYAVYVHEEVLGLNRSQAHSHMTLQSRRESVEGYVKGGRKLSDWTSWVGLETYLQLQDKFGWDAFKKLIKTCRAMSGLPESQDGVMNLFAEIFSQTVGMNLTGFFKAWGWPITTATEEKLANLPPWTDHPMVEYD